MSYFRCIAVVFIDKKKRTDLIAFTCLVMFFLANLNNQAVAAQPTFPVTQKTAINITHKIKLNKDCHLTFSWGPWRPYQYINTRGELVGSQIRLIHHIAGRIGCKVSFKKMFFSDALQAIEAGNIDATSHVKKTPERQKFAHFSEFYSKDYYAIYVLADKFHQYKNQTIEQMLTKGFRLGITKAHFYGREFKTIQENPLLNKTISEASDSYDNYPRLINGEIDGFIDNPFIAAYAIRNQKRQKHIVRHPTNFFGESISFMFSKKTVDLEVIHAINEVLAELKTDPDYQKKWNFRL
ncbi:transporter substrate-binding domain-containing protein [Aliikangiella coralliicola]|uniref:Amino acid ABC transporter substrate-binding protein n=1 Tax=Aliikangiella coralliicola TaxID=2592383 RepID=A0A545UGX9_9GAMM|nr:transporter substrate-binding domain-containing protein [Aliikangiella coralliicola]TQV88709.1 amino acid ABC transporter substrate-binding protein [Aliikangiella coralliicola]